MPIFNLLNYKYYLFLTLNKASVKWFLSLNIGEFHHDRAVRQPTGRGKRLYRSIRASSQLAKLNKLVLVIGERGTGKELIAHRLHYLSNRWQGPFISINCAALNDNLLDSELFGHEAGSFTGAQKRHLGCFERADGGTLFLDELATAPMLV